MSLASELLFSAGKNPATKSLTASDDRSEISGLDQKLDSETWGQKLMITLGSQGGGL